MSAKKTTLITVGSVLGFILLSLLAVLAVRFASQMNSNAEIDNGNATSAYFEVRLPDGAGLTNDSATSNIYASAPTNYGELRVSITRRDYEVTQISQRGQVTSEQVSVDGVSTTLNTIDYQGVVRGDSDKLLIRYEVSSDKIAKPSDREYTAFEVRAMSLRDLTASEKSSVKNEANKVLKGLIIK